MRILILQRDQPELYERTIGKFESHWKIREKQPGVAGLLRYITAFIRSRLGLSWVTAADVQHGYGVLKTNGVGGGRACYLYPHLSLVTHSCLANTEVQARPGRQITLVALTHINRGDELTWSYSNILLAREQRQAHLSHTWLFQCRCGRCSDPQELGLHYSAQQCGCGGHLSLQQGDSLACTHCPSHAPRLDLARADDTLLQTISQLEPAGLHHLLSQLLQDYRYHTTHHVIIRASIRWSTCSDRIETSLKFIPF